jgi:hypothetical protein
LALVHGIRRSEFIPVRHHTLVLDGGYPYQIGDSKKAMIVDSRLPIENNGMPNIFIGWFLFGNR